jgi:hypothetical protein
MSSENGLNLEDCFQSHKMRLHVVVPKIRLRVMIDLPEPMSPKKQVFCQTQHFRAFQDSLIHCMEEIRSISFFWTDSIVVFKLTLKKMITKNIIALCNDIASCACG